MQFITYYLTEAKQYRLCRNEHSFETVDRLPMNENLMELGRGYEKTDEDLYAYGLVLDHDNNQLLNDKSLNHTFNCLKSKVLKSSKTTFYRRSNNVAISYFKTKCASSDRDFDMIEGEEDALMDMPYNAGLLYADKGEFNVDSYDYQMFYPRLLADPNFKFPCEAGQYTDWLDEFPIYNTNDDIKQIKHGYYFLNVQVHKQDILKVFKISKHNTYTNYDVISLMKLRRLFGIDSIDIEVIKRPYLYFDVSLVPGDTVFESWYKSLLKMKKKYPKNKIVKILSSSLWGFLTQKNIVTVPEDDMEDYEDYKCVDCIHAKNQIYYKLIPPEKSYYKNNFRLKPFITSYGRLEMLKPLIIYLPNIRKIVTDGFLIDSERKGVTNEFKRYKTLILESDKCGRVLIDNSRSLYYI